MVEKPFGFNKALLTMPYPKNIFNGIISTTDRFIYKQPLGIHCQIINDNWVANLIDSHSSNKRKWNMFGWFKKKESDIECQIKKAHNRITSNWEYLEKRLAELEEELHIHKKLIGIAPTMVIKSTQWGDGNSHFNPFEEQRMQAEREQAAVKGYKHFHTKKNGDEVWIEGVKA